MSYKVDPHVYKIYNNPQGNVALHLTPVLTKEVQTFTVGLVLSQGKTKFEVIVHPESRSKSKVRIFLFAENTAEIDCVCDLRIPKNRSGVETDVQIRSWPFDSSKIKARPEMRIYNSDVVATHGNALGTLKPQEQYYLATRGIDNYKELIKTSLLHEKL